MKFYFHPAADKEFDQTVEYYEDREPGLGLEFAQELYPTITRIIKHPQAWSPMSKNTRRCLTNRFPYGVIYQVKNKRLRIIAVANLNHRPGYWEERLS